MFSKMLKHHSKRLLNCHALKDVVCILDQNIAQEAKLVATQGSMLKVTSCDPMVTTHCEAT